MLDSRFSLQFITHFTDSISYLESAMLALRGGCRWVQLRMKDASDEEILAVSRPLREACTQYGAIFLLDDHVDLVVPAGADGVHLGKDDMPIAEARRILGADRIIGGTANTFADVENHYRQGADYVGCGPFRFTTTKQKLAPVLGIEGYESIISRMHAAGINIPVVAIGGITNADIPPILATGVSGIALSGSILRAADPIAETTQLINIINR